jgi:hypothetical protein
VWKVSDPNKRHQETHKLAVDMYAFFVVQFFATTDSVLIGGATRSPSVPREGFPGRRRPYVEKEIRFIPGRM